MRSAHVLALVSLLATALMFGCGSPATETTGDTSTTAIGTVDGQTTSPTYSAETGTVRFTAPFPSQTAYLGSQGGVQEYRIEWRDQFYTPGAGSPVFLTPGNPSYNAVIPVGNWVFEVTSTTTASVYNSNTVIEQVINAGEIQPGTNTVYISFLTGNWDFTAPIPLQLSDETLAGFTLEMDPWNMSNVTPAWNTPKWDITKPIGWADYGFAWYNVTDVYAPGGVGEAYHDTQFLGQNNFSSFGDGDYNYTKAAYGWGENGPGPSPGDVIFGIAGAEIPEPIGAESVWSDPSIAPKWDTAIAADALSINGHVYELVYQYRDILDASYNAAMMDEVGTYNAVAVPLWCEQDVYGNLYGGAFAAADGPTSLSEAIGAMLDGPQTAAFTPHGPITVTMHECDQEDGDGDADYHQEWWPYDPSTDLVSDGIYNSTDDACPDTNGDANCDWVYPRYDRSTMAFSDSYMHDFTATPWVHDKFSSSIFETTTTVEIR